MCALRTDLRRYFELLFCVEGVEVGDDAHGLTKLELTEFLPKLREWGVELSDEQADSEFDFLGRSSSAGEVSLGTFTDWAISRSLDAEVAVLSDGFLSDGTGPWSG